MQKGDDLMYMHLHVKQSTAFPELMWTDLNKVVVHGGANSNVFITYAQQYREHYETTPTSHAI